MNSKRTSKNKGFTLVEVIGAIVILGIIALIAIPYFTRNLESFREDYYKNIEMNLSSSGKEFYTDNRLYLPNRYLEASKVTLKTLESEKYIEEVLDYEGNKCNSDSYVIVIKKSKEEYEYHLCLRCEQDNYDNTSKNECDSAWTTTDTLTVELGEPPDIYVYKGTSREKLREKLTISADIVKYNNKGEEIGRVSGEGEEGIPQIVPSNIDTIDTNKVGEYETVYQYGGVTKKGKVIVYENEAPKIAMEKINKIVTGNITSPEKEQRSTYKNGEWGQKVVVTITPPEGFVGKITKYQWKRGNRWIDFCTANNSGTCEVQVTEEMNEIVIFRMIDNEGNVSVETRDYNMKIDSTKPICELKLDGSMVNSEWYTGDVTISFNQDKTYDQERDNKDAVSGINKKGISKGPIGNDLIGKQTANTREVTWYGYVEDYAGNFNKCSVTFKKDSNVPDVSITATKKNANSKVASGVWTNEALNYMITSSNVGVSNATIYYCKDTTNSCTPNKEVKSNEVITEFNTTEGIYYVRYQIVSGARLKSDIYSYNAMVDLTPPTIVSVTGNPTNWVNTDVTLTVNGAADSGSGVRTTLAYSFDNGIHWQNENSKTYENNTSNIIIKVRDNVGNVYTHETINITLIDKKRPTCELAVIEGSKVKDYYYTDVTIGFSKAEDTGGSGVAAYGIGDFTTKTFTLREDKSTIYTGNIRDGAGNTNTCIIAINRKTVYNLTYDANGGNACSPASRTIKREEVYGDLCTPTRAGYSFEGWYTARSGGELIDRNTKVTVTGDQTIYARWSQCPVGTYNDGTKPSCTPCPNGYTSDKGATAVNKCFLNVPAGSNVGTPGGGVSECPAGTYNGGERVYYGSTNSCKTCDEGTYSLKGSGSCTKCPSGYTSVKGATAKNRCYIDVPAGSQVRTPGGTATECSAGTYNGGERVYYGDTNSCKTCEAGTYSLKGSGSCTQCPSGYTSTEGATAENKCYIDVPAGSHVGTPGGTATQCLAGTYRTGHTVYYGKTSDCIKCRDGYTSDDGAEGATKCYMDVPAGKRVATPGGLATDCGVGTYSTGERLYYGSTNSCAECPENYQNSAKGATGVDKCYMSVPAGQHVGTARNGAENCKAGYGSSDHTVYYGQTSSCTKCSAGYYSTGGTSCKKCPTGYTSDEGATAENECYMDVPAGKHIEIPGGLASKCDAGTGTANHRLNYGETSSCAQCTGGTYSTGGTSCSNCPTGYTSEPGATAINKCYMDVPAGKHVGTARGSAEDCKAGYGSSDHPVYYGQTSSCTKCSAGYYSTGGTSCKKCPDSYPNSEEGATSESSCYMSVSAGQHVETARGSAQNCSSGTYSTDHPVYYGSTSSCSNCPYNYPNSEEGSTAATKCYMDVPAGQHVGRAHGGAENCKAGYGSSKHPVYYGGTSSCAICPSGYYSTVGTSCTKCPDSYPKSEPGTTAINECYMNVPGGGFVAKAGAGVSKCPAETYSTGGKLNYGRTSTCKPCAPGSTSPEGATSCTSTGGGGSSSGGGSGSGGGSSSGGGGGSSTCDPVIKVEYDCPTGDGKHHTATYTAPDEPEHDSDFCRGLSWGSFCGPGNTAINQSCKRDCR